MSETKHTPGPWTLERCFARNEWSLNGANVYAGRFIGTARDMKEADANALLIAAAPELLDMLKRCAAHIERQRFGSGNLESDVLAAIAKSEGRS